MENKSKKQALIVTILLIVLFVLSAFTFMNALYCLSDCIASTVSASADIAIRDALRSVPVFLSNRVVEVKVEIQIRTVAMDFWASLEHKIYYKFEGNAPEHIQQSLVNCAKIVEQLDAEMLSLNNEVQNFVKE